MGKIDDLIKHIKETGEGYKELLSELKMEKRRMVLSTRNRLYSLAQDEIEGIFDDMLMKCIDEYEEGKPFLALLRIAFRNSCINACSKVIKQAHYESLYAEQVAPFTNAVQTITENEVEFKQYVSTLDEPLQQACRLLEAGNTLNQVAQHLGYGDQRTLKRKLQKAFEPFFKDIEHDDDKDK